MTTTTKSLRDTLAAFVRVSESESDRDLHGADMTFPRPRRRTSIVTSCPKAARNTSSRSRLKPRNRPRSIFETSGWLMPMRSAASFFTPLAVLSARRIVSCSIHSMLVRSFSEGRLLDGDVTTPSTDTEAGPMTPSVERTTARSIVFSSSRTFPGHW